MNAEWEEVILYFNVLSKCIYVYQQQRKEAFEQKKREEAEQLEAERLKRAEKRKKRKESDRKADKEAKLAKLNAMPTDGSFMDFFLKTLENPTETSTTATKDNSEKPAVSGSEDE